MKTLLLGMFLSLSTFAQNLKSGDIVIVNFGGIHKSRILEVVNNSVATTTTGSLYIPVDNVTLYKAVESIQHRTIGDVVFKRPGHVYKLGDIVLADYGGKLKGQILDLTQDKLVMTSTSSPIYIGLDKIEPLNEQ